MRKLSTKEKFCNRIVPIECGCLIWIGPLCSSYKYGQISEGNKTFTAHKWIYEKKHGPVPKGWDVCHRCPCCKNAMTLCVNDLHLQADTRQGNIADRAPETLRGERNGNAKLTRFDIIAIKTLWGLGFSQKQIASQFNIQPNHIYRIHSHRKWGWL